MAHDRTPFAFRLADVHEAEQKKASQSQWHIRDGLAIAGCSDRYHTGDPQMNFYLMIDGGPFC